MRQTHIYENGSSHMLKVWLLEEVTQSLLQPLMKWIWEEMVYEDIEDSSRWNSYILLLWSIGLSYYQGGCNTNHKQVSSARTNQTQVLTWEKTLSTTPALSDLEAYSWLGWISLETIFLESSRSLKTKFRVKSYDIFCEVTYAVFQSYSSATNFRSSVAPWQCRRSERIVPHMYRL
jgi:hypothetical protein